MLQSLQMGAEQWRWSWSTWCCNGTSLNNSPSLPHQTSAPCTRHCVRHPQSYKGRRGCGCPSEFKRLTTAATDPQRTLVLCSFMFLFLLKGFVFRFQLKHHPRSFHIRKLSFCCCFRVALRDRFSGVVREWMKMKSRSNFCGFRCKVCWCQHVFILKPCKHVCVFFLWKKR